MSPVSDKIPRLWPGDFFAAKHDPEKCVAVFIAALWHVADRVDFEPAVHRGATGLHARARGQRSGAAEIAAVDAVEFFLLALVPEPHDHLEQAIHVRAGGLDQRLQVVHDDAGLALERNVGEGRNGLALGARLAQLRGISRVKRRQAGNEDLVSVPDAKIEWASGFRNVRLDHLLVHDVCSRKRDDARHPITAVQRCHRTANESAAAPSGAAASGWQSRLTNYASGNATIVSYL